MTPNDAARARFETSGLTYDDITADDIEELYAMLVETMADTRARLKDHPVQGHWKMHKGHKDDYTWDGHLLCAFLRCYGSYFTDREAISFNRDGYIGFCGWASTQNTVPITDTFIRWCDHIAARKK